MKYRMETRKIDVQIKILNIMGKQKTNFLGFFFFIFL